MAARCVYYFVLFFYSCFLLRGTKVHRDLSVVVEIMCLWYYQMEVIFVVYRLNCFVCLIVGMSLYTCIVLSSNYNVAREWFFCVVDEPIN